MSHFFFHRLQKPLPPVLIALLASSLCASAATKREDRRSRLIMDAVERSPGATRAFLEAAIAIQMRDATDVLESLRHFSLTSR